jgi:hypothetical protein
MLKTPPQRRRGAEKTQRKALKTNGFLCVASAFSLRLRASLALGHCGKFLTLLLALSLPYQPTFADSVKILVQSSPLAGSQYYALSEAWPQIKPGDRLTLTREPDNRHDRNAIRVDWNGRQLGYVPRAENRAVAAALDRGEKLEARVSKLREEHNPWRRVEFEVYLTL